MRILEPSLRLQLAQLLSEPDEPSLPPRRQTVTCLGAEDRGAIWFGLCQRWRVYRDVAREEG